MISKDLVHEIEMGIINGNSWRWAIEKAFYAGKDSEILKVSEKLEIMFKLTQRLSSCEILLRNEYPAEAGLLRDQLQKHKKIIREVELDLERGVGNEPKKSKIKKS
jgi:hypothetical protein